MLVRKAIEVSGIVQGVGFRPYIYRLANEQQLAGTVCNTAAGVSIEVQGPPTAVDDFLVRLPVEAPRLARITGITVRETRDLWDMPIVFFLVLLLCCTEWVLRRRWGVV